MLAPWLTNLDEATYYTSAPGIAAGVAANGFVSSAACMVYQPGIFTLAANYDDVANEGWRIMLVDGGGGSIRILAEVAITDGVTPTTVVVGDWYDGLVGQACEVVLEVGAGVNGALVLYANGNILSSGSLGAGFSFLPASGQPLQIGGPQTAPGVGEGAAAGKVAAVLGYGFLNSEAPFGGAFGSGVAMSSYLTRQQHARYSPFVDSNLPGSLVTGFADAAWDTESALGENRRTGPVNAATWNEAPGSGAQQLSVQGGDIPLVYSLDALVASRGGHPSGRLISVEGRLVAYPCAGGRCPAPDGRAKASNRPHSGWPVAA